MGDQAQPIVVNLDGDPWDDIVWTSPAPNDPDAIWWGTPNDLLTATSTFPDRMAVVITDTYRPTVGQFDGAGGEDIVWFRPAP